MIDKRFYKREARTDNFYDSHCYASCDPKKIMNISLYTTKYVFITILMS